jgi:hypothetical protein
MTADFGSCRLPFRVTLMAAALAGTIALPLSKTGSETLLGQLLEAIGKDWLSGLMMAIVFGAPHGFALAVVFASRTGGAYSGAAVRAWVALLQTEVVIIGLITLRNLGEAHSLRAPWAIIGFAFVSVAYFAYRVASPNVPPHRRDTGFFAKWGALLIVGVFGWFELQLLGHRNTVGLWLHGTLVAAFALAASVPRDR